MDNEVRRDAARFQPIDEYWVVQERRPWSNADVGGLGFSNREIDRNKFGNLLTKCIVSEHSAADESGGTGYSRFLRILTGGWHRGKSSPTGEEQGFSNNPHREGFGRRHRLHG